MTSSDVRRAFRPGPLFFRLLYLEVIATAALFALQFNIALPTDESDWPLSILSLVNLAAAGCIALFAAFVHEGASSVRRLLLATGVLFLLVPPVQSILPDHTVDYQDWASLLAWFLSFFLIGAILIREKASPLVQALFLGGLVAQGAVMLGGLSFDDFLHPSLASM